MLVTFSGVFMENVLEETMISTISWSESELGEFNNRLTEEKSSATEQLQYIKERIQDIDERLALNGSSEGDITDFGSLQNDKSVAELEYQRLEKYISKIDLAFERLDNGTYGICVKCNCKINKERLLAVPITTLSATFKLTNSCPIDGIDRAVPKKRP